MFNRQVATVLDFPRPEGRLPSNNALQLRTYDQVARELNFNSEDLVRARLLNFFHEQGIKVYDYQEVDRYLKQKRKADKQEYWVWRPLRLQDKPSDNWDGIEGTWLGDGSYRQDRCPPYSRIVPKHALDKVLLIDQAFRDQVQFFVSDYAVKKPDPFIAVRVKNSTDLVDTAMLVFDVWDEPNFGC